MAAERTARDRWLRAERVFEHAVELPADEIQGYLASACGDDLEVRQEVEELLAAHRAADEGFLATSAPARAAAAFATQSPAVGPPQQVGVWKLLELLGEGGMGRVFLAERADGQFEQRAAVKLLKPGLVERAAVARFLRERQILARLDHPGIARLLDGGLTADGTPYLVLEKVDGEPITAWCERRGTALEDRLRLFLAVCAAVAAAHRSLVVHRDLKPSNILVTAEGEVKLLDFGIAKPLGEAGETHTLERVLTPEYAAPEQIAGGPVTTTTDVYALGVVLYELLAGRVPHSWRERQSFFDFEQRVVATEAVRPSAALAAAARAQPGPQRSALSAQARRLVGDLDAIVLEALRKEPEARYPSVEALAADVERFLGNRPVEARGGAASYRARKFVQRHRLALAAALLLTLSLAAGVVATVWQAARARHEAAKARGIADFLLGLFTSQDPYQANGEERTARQLLELGARDVETKLAGQPEVQAAIYEEVAAVYLQLGEYRAAEPLTRKLLALQERLHGPRSQPAVAARIFVGNIVSELGRYDEAEAIFRRAETDETAERGADARLVGEALRGLAGVLASVARYDEAERAERRALAILRKTAGDSDPMTLIVMNNLGVILSHRGKLAESEDLQRRHIALLEKRPGESEAGTLIPRYNLGTTIADEGRYVEAEAIFREVLPAARKVFGPHHPVVVKILRRLARTLDLLGRTAEAEPFVAESTAAVEASDSEEERALQRTNVAYHALEAGDPRRAEAEARAGLSFYLARLGEHNDTTAFAHAALGQALAAEGRLAEARPELEAAVATDSEVLGADDRATLGLDARLARVLAGLGDRERALRLFESTTKAERRVLGESHDELGRTLLGWAEALDRPAEAARRRELLEEALRILRRALPAGHPQIREAEHGLAAAAMPAS